MADERPDHSGVVVPPPFIYLAGIGLGWLLQPLLPAHPFPPLVVRVVGPLLALAGVALLCWAMVTFRRAGTNINPRLPVTTVVPRGPYRFTRNPMYVSLAVLTIGLALRMNMLGPLLLLPVVLVVVDRTVIAREERYLERKFGDEYRAYKARVRRWV